ncbi:glycosyltransferase [uncultured Tateyamaria sp.]|uniref:glycosyltransferase n=1 Tax=uncultured Tateyamaria sp. TaxID=455651 RepID=UPI002622AC43|nr:glycosyltransferase [uncultured Tateyamaria sp.]
MTADRALALLSLYLRAGRMAEAAVVSAWLADRLGTLNNAQLRQFIKVAETSDQPDLMSAAIAHVETRSLIDMPLAKVVLRIAHVAENEALAERTEDALCARMAPALQPPFRIMAARMRKGPQAALERTLEIRTGQRSPRAAADLAQLLIDNGRKQLAIRYLRLSARRWPNALPVLTTLTQSFIQAGLPDAGLAWLDSHRGAKNVQALEDLRMKLLLALGRPEEVVALIEAGIAAGQRPPDDTTLLQLFCVLNRLEDAERTATAIQTNPRHASRKRAHFGTTLFGARLNELRLYRISLQHQAEPHPGPDLAASNFQAANDVLNMWDTQKAGSGEHTAPHVTPRHIFQYWNTAKVPDAIHGVMQTWADAPGWRYERFDRARAIAWLTEAYDAAHARAFEVARHVAEESDFLRLCVLYRQGGIYADADDMLTGHPDDIVAKGPGLIVFREPFGALANNLICAPPGHPAIGQAITMAKAALIGRDNDSTWSKTGPGLLTRAVAWHMLAHPQDARRDTTMLPQSHMFLHTLPHVKLPYKTTASYWHTGTFRTTGRVVSALQTLAHTAHN